MNNDININSFAKTFIRKWCEVYIYGATYGEELKPGDWKPMGRVENPGKPRGKVENP